MTLVLWHRAWGMGRGFALAGKGLLELVEVAGARVSFAQRAFAGAAAPPAELCKPEIRERAGRGRLPQSNLGGSCLQASGNPIHSEELEPAAAFPIAICKSVKYSCRATCEGRLTPLSVSRFSSPAYANGGFFSCRSSRVAGTAQIFSLASRYL